METVRDIERAIGGLSQQGLVELYAWLDEHIPQPIDACIPSDLGAGRLDAAIERALDDEKYGRDQSMIVCAVMPVSLSPR
ncbi:MAG: hypothetical protein ACRD3N_00380 [Terracidiphilus sp.]